MKEKRNRRKAKESEEKQRKAKERGLPYSLLSPTFLLFLFSFFPFLYIPQEKKGRAVKVGVDTRAAVESVSGAPLFSYISLFLIRFLSIGYSVFYVSGFRFLVLRTP